MKRRIVVTAGLIMVAALAGIALHVMSAPVNGQVIHAGNHLRLKNPSPSRKPAPKLPLGSLQSTYFQLDLPAGYSIQPAAVPVTGLLYQQMLVKPSASGSMVIALAIKALSNGGLDEDSSYALRKQHPDLYAMSSQTIAGEAVTVVIDKQSAAVTAFWPHGNYLATVSVTLGVSTPGSTDAGQETTVLQSLLDGWQWR